MPLNEVFALLAAKPGLAEDVYVHVEVRENRSSRVRIPLSSCSVIALLTPVTLFLDYPLYFRIGLFRCSLLSNFIILNNSASFVIRSAPSPSSPSRHFFVMGSFAAFSMANTYEHASECCYELVITAAQSPHLKLNLGSGAMKQPFMSAGMIALITSWMSSQL
jgi:hypothetical protein